jgi:hypothetical protein
MHCFKLAVQTFRKEMRAFSCSSVGEGGDLCPDSANIKQTKITVIISLEIKCLHYKCVVDPLQFEVALVVLHLEDMIITELPRAVEPGAGGAAVEAWIWVLKGEARREAEFKS